MIAYPDPSFLCSVYREQEHSARADAWMERREEPLPVTPFLLLEFRNAVRFQVWLHDRDRTKGYSAREGEGMLRDSQADLAAGVLEVVPAEWADVHRLAEQLSARHTREGGHRLADLMHVATALHFGSPGFLSFDGRQRALAEGEGMALRV